MLTIEKFNEMPDGEIFGKGIVTDNPEGVNMTNSGDKLKWVAKKGGGDDWAIYIHQADSSTDYIKRYGDKVKGESNILKLIPCDKEVLKKYRF